MKESGLLVEALTLSNHGIKVTHAPTGLSVSCGSERSQWANRRVAMEQLSELLIKDQLAYGISIEKDGKRIDPLNVMKD